MMHVIVFSSLMHHIVFRFNFSFAVERWFGSTFFSCVVCK